LSYGRSRFFTFLFFMLKISRIRPYENNKSCSILHLESKKIKFEFFLISYDFIRILQVSAKGQTLFQNTISRRPLKRFNPLQCCPWPWPAARGGQILATPVRELAGKGCGEEGELTRDRFAILHRVEGLPAGSCGGDGGCRPWWPPVPARLRPGQGMGGSGSYCRC
jgi:hypothetical protein